MITLKQLKNKLEKEFGWENLESDDNKWLVDDLLKDTIQAIEVMHRCKSDSEQLVCDNCKYTAIYEGYEISYLECMKCGKTKAY